MNTILNPNAFDEGKTGDGLRAGVPYFKSMWPWRGPIRMAAPTIREIAERVAERHGVAVGDLVGPSRVRSVTWPRQDAMVEAYATGAYSLPDIGSFFNRDHTSVIHAIRTGASRQGRIYPTRARPDASPKAKAVNHLLALARALVQQEAA